MKKLLLLAISVWLLAGAPVKAQNTYNFENWTGNEPNGWITLNSLPGAPQTTFKETANPGQGSSSVKLVTVACPVCPNFFLSNPLPGLVSLGNNGVGMPFTIKPLSVDFKYKSKPLNGDIGGFMVQLTRWNQANQEADVIGEAWFTSGIQVNNWTSVNLPIAYNSTLAPDTLIISAVSSIGHSMFTFPGLPTPVAGSEFYVDAVNVNLPSCVSLSLNVSGTNETAPLAGNGTATANVTGGAAPYMYQWSTGATSSSINNLIPGVYAVNVTDANGCTRTGTVNVLKGGCNGLAVSVTGTYSTNFGSNDGSATATVTGGTPPYTYQWNTGATTASVSGLDVGAYTVMVIDNTGACVQWGYFTTFNSGSTTGISTEAQNNAVQVYPNPGNGVFNIKAGGKLSKAEVTNTLGEKVYSKNINTEDAFIDLSHQAKGVYFLTLLQGEKVIAVKKLIVSN